MEPEPPHGGVRGHDVSSHQKDVDWPSAKAKGAGFVYVKATESTAYRNPYFTRQYDGAGTAGLLRGAYHFAVPDKSSGTDQAAYFVRNGGADGRTLPPALDIEYDPYARRRSCYGLRPAAMVRWIREFSDEVERETGRTPVIYTTAHWWNTCTGSSRAFAARHALWLARYGAADPGRSPRAGPPGPSGSTTPPAACRVTRISSTAPLPASNGWRGDSDPYRSPAFRLRSNPGISPWRQAERGFAVRDTTKPDPVHLPFIQVAYGPPATDVQQKPG